MLDPVTKANVAVGLTAVVTGFVLLVIMGVA
jgi:hypothetical protein